MEDDDDEDAAKEVEEWVEEVAAMTDGERTKFQQRLVPIRQTLTKVSRLNDCQIV